MDIEIRRLSQKNMADYMDFFDNVAFTDHEEWKGCYCVHFHWDSKLEAAHQRAGAHKRGRDYGLEFLKNGVIQGYMAYIDGRVAGWCNANDKTGFARLIERAEIWDEKERSAKVKAIVCFLVAPDMRGKGIAMRLLQRVCEDAAAEGYDYVEAYPHKSETDVYINHHGPYAMYEKCGFSPVKTCENDVVVRKYFR